MKFRRGTVRRVAAIWLMVQMAWLTALIPRDCCAAHQPMVSQEAGCHSTGPAAQCPMRSADGIPCPMHSAPVSHDAHGHEATGDHHASGDTPARCVLRGSCAGPMAALLVLLANHGVLPEFTTAVPDVAVRPIVMAAVDRTAGHFVPPDPPPPRA
ncbi:MAG TPA: hypothetical protein VGD94_19375 [Vicinamibacterales bacterium]